MFIAKKAILNKKAPAPTLVEDTTGSAVGAALTADGGSGTLYWRNQEIALAGSQGEASVTPTFAAGSRAVGVACLVANVMDANALKLRVIMGGVVVTESAFLPTGGPRTHIVVGTWALAGAQACTCTMYNEAGDPIATYRLYAVSNAASQMFARGAIGVGSIKT